MRAARLARLGLTVHYVSALLASQKDTAQTDLIVELHPGHAVEETEPMLGVGRDRAPAFDEDVDDPVLAATWVVTAPRVGPPGLEPGTLRL